ncbi:hypothetical protein [Natrialba sp. SSL1]|uniref:hypothetical protein n=1 Tax=Natrialba sp. SSL1 TaxID=1869245 RepID=UPI0008F94EFF|nr:hypothetical protein [Natrialba sp. SSL1]OIB57101.1 hypothetical protein BBD46_15295 [Natrialba sp. SSL1]
MRRRALLASTVPVVGGGCLSRVPTSRFASHPTPTELTASALNRIDEDESEEVPDTDEPPTTSFDEAESTAQLVGTVSYASTTCGDISLSSAQYDADEAMCTVRVVGTRNAPSTEQECTADIAVGSYRVTLEFDDGVPERIEAIESGPDGTQETEETYSRV